MNRATIAIQTANRYGRERVQADELWSQIVAILERVGAGFATDTERHEDDALELLAAFETVASLIDGKYLTRKHYTEPRVVGRIFTLQRIYNL